MTTVNSISQCAIGRENKKSIDQSKRPIYAVMVLCGASKSTVSDCHENSFRDFEIVFSFVFTPRSPGGPG